MSGYRTLAVVQQLGQARVDEIAGAIAEDLETVLDECRSLERNSHLEAVGPMTFRTTSEGVDHLHRWLQSRETIDVDQFSLYDPDADGASATDDSGDVGGSGTDGPGIDAPSATNDQGRTAALRYRVLLAVQYLDRTEIRHVAALAGTNVAAAFRTCRTLKRAGALEKVRPMTYRITRAGVEDLEEWVSDSERLDGVDDPPVDVQHAMATLLAEEDEIHSGPLSLATSGSADDPDE
jgi:predicted transcriptional regulator